LFFLNKFSERLAVINQFLILPVILLASNPLLDLVGLLLGKHWFNVF
jgi:hypothetical protein